MTQCTIGLGIWIRGACTVVVHIKQDSRPELAETKLRVYFFSRWRRLSIMLQAAMDLVVRLSIRGLSIIVGSHDASGTLMKGRWTERGTLGAPPLRYQSLTRLLYAGTRCDRRKSRRKDDIDADHNGPITTLVAYDGHSQRGSCARETEWQEEQHPRRGV